MHWQHIFLASLAIHVPSTLATSPRGIERDIVIIGGGSAGTFAAVRLQQSGKSVALIERNSRLGGQVNTYTDPDTNKTIDYGVKVFRDVALTRTYLKSLGASMVSFTGFVSNETTVYTDLSTGQEVTPIQGHSNNVTLALERYAEQMTKYPWLGNGYDLPKSIPLDLLLPFPDFVRKYDLWAAVPLIRGYVGALAVKTLSTLYVAKGFGVDAAFLAAGELAAKDGNNQGIYDRALALLRRGGENSAILDSHVMSVRRSGSSVVVQTMTPSGPVRIHAKKLVIAAPPTTENLRFLDLDEEECGLFEKFHPMYEWAAVVSNVGTAPNVELQNYNPKNNLGLPDFPCIFDTAPTGVDNRLIAWYGSVTPMSSERVQQDMVSQLERWKSVNHEERNDGRVEIAAFESHSPYWLTVSNEDIERGFYRRLTSLQGRRNTYWTGSTWQSPDSSQIWNFTETSVLAPLLSSLSRG